MRLRADDLGPLIGSVYLPSFLVALGTGMVLPVDPSRRFFELIEAQGMSNVLGEDSKVPGISPIYGTTYSVVYPHVKHTNAICSLTNI